MAKKYEFWDRPKIVELAPGAVFGPAGTRWEKLVWIPGGLANITFSDQFDQLIRMIS